MSCIEIYKIDTDGYSHYYDDVPNSWMGSMRVWSVLEEKYLSQYIPDTLVEIYENILDGRRRRFEWLKEKYKTIEDFKKNATKEDIKLLYGYIPTRCSSLSIEPMKEIWNLVDDTKLTLAERMCLWTTFDYSVVKKENISDIINAMKEFSTEIFQPQIDVLNELLKEPDCYAIAWNQTSINCAYWRPCIAECDEDEKPFNLFDKRKENEDIEFLDERFEI